MKIKTIYKLNDMVVEYIGCMTPFIDIWKGTDGHYYFTNTDDEVVGKCTGNLVICKGDSCNEV